VGLFDSISEMNATSVTLSPAISLPVDTPAARARETHVYPFNVLKGIGGGDIDAIAFLVMMEAAHSAQDDLRTIMAGVKAINNAKGQQQPLARLRQDEAIGCAIPPGA
jgi:hypothetical protein